VTLPRRTAVVFFVRSPFMKNVALGFLIAIVWAGVPDRAAVPTMPFADVRSGMTGTAQTVFDGTEIETIEIEILGKIPNIGPRQDLILARCSGGPLARTGILAGMSGSPVTIDGKLVGAIAYSWGFSTEAIAGITPIEEMLDVRRRAGPGGSRAGDFRLETGWDRAFHDVSALNLLWEKRLETLGAAPRGEWKQPLGLSGFGVRGARAIEKRLAGTGIGAVQVAGSGAAGDTAPPLRPGSPIGLKLVRGDVEMAATGTVTWVEGNEVLALGHPLFGLGSVDLPMTAARVEALLPSLAGSSRVAVPLNEIGALREDRTAGVYGTLGGEPSMIPVRVQLESGSTSDTFSFDVADDPLLAPVLFYLSLNGILGSAERAGGNATLRIGAGSVIKMADGRDVSLDNVFAGPQALGFATGLPAYILHLLMNNVWAPPRVTGVNIILEYDELPRTTRLVRVIPDRYRVAPGETVDLELVLSPFRGPRRTLQASVRIPDEQPAGKLSVLVAGAAIVQRDERTDEPVLPRDLDQLILLINQLRRNDRIYIMATAPDDGWLLDGARLSNLPPSVASVLVRPAGHGNRAAVRRRHAIEESLPVGEVVEGQVRLELEVAPR